MRWSRKSKQHCGQAIIETIAGIIVIVPLLLSFLDFGAVLLGLQYADQLAKKTARAAAGTTSTIAAGTAATAILNNEKTSPIITNIGLWQINYQGGSYGNCAPPTGFTVQPNGTPPQTGIVISTVYVVVQLPFPIPVIPNSYCLYSQDLEPIVALQPVDLNAAGAGAGAAAAN